MVKDLQRILIAEACGWTEITRKNRHEYGGLVGVDTDTIRKIVPSFCTCLNAMHKAEKVLNEPVNMQKHAWNNYRALLEEITKGSSFHATAAQKAEAFLKTLKLWQE